MHNQHFLLPGFKQVKSKIIPGLERLGITIKLALSLVLVLSR